MYTQCIIYVNVLLCLNTVSVWCVKSGVTVVWDENRTSRQCDTTIRCGAHFSLQPHTREKPITIFIIIIISVG